MVGLHLRGRRALTLALAAGGAGGHCQRPLAAGHKHPGGKALAKGLWRNVRNTSSIFDNDVDDVYIAGKRAHNRTQHEGV